MTRSCFASGRKMCRERGEGEYPEETDQVNELS